MAKTKKRSGENKYQLAKNGAFHKLDRLNKKLDKKLKEKKNGSDSEHGD